MEGVGNFRRKDILNEIENLKGVKILINKSELARRFGCF